MHGRAGRGFHLDCVVNGTLDNRVLAFFSIQRAMGVGSVSGCPFVPPTEGQVTHITISVPNEQDSPSRRFKFMFHIHDSDRNSVSPQDAICNDARCGTHTLGAHSALPLDHLLGLTLSCCPLGLPGACWSRRKLRVLEYLLG